MLATFWRGSTSRAPKKESDFSARSPALGQTCPRARGPRRAGRRVTCRSFRFAASVPSETVLDGYRFQASFFFFPFSDFIEASRGKKSAHNELRKKVQETSDKYTYKLRNFRALNFLIERGSTCGDTCSAAVGRAAPGDLVLLTSSKNAFNC